MTPLRPPIAPFFVFAALLAALLWRPLASDAWFVTEAQGGLTIAATARNFLRIGVTELRGVAVEGYDRRSPDAYRWFPRHPPLHSLLVAGAFATFGETPLVLRLLNLALWAATAAVVFVLARALSGTAAGWCAGLALCVAPGAQQHLLSSEVVTGPVLLLSNLAILAHLAHERRPGALRAAALVLAVALAVLADWQGVILAGLLAADALAARRRWRSAHLALPALALALLGGWAAWVGRMSASFGTHAGGGAGSSLGAALATFAARVNESFGPLDLPRLGAIEGAARALRLAAGHAGWPLLLLAGAGAVAIAVRLVRGRDGVEARAAVLALLVPLAVILVFSRCVVLHPFWAIAALPGIALFAGAGAGALLAAARARPARALIALAVAAALGFEAQRGWRAWSGRLPALEAQGRTLAGLAALIEARGPAGGRVLVADPWLRPEQLAFLIDRPVHPNVASEGALADALRTLPQPLAFLARPEDLRRLPRLAAALLRHPAEIAPEAVLVRFDQSGPPAAELFPAVADNVRALADSTPASGPAIAREAGGAAGEVLAVDAGGPVILFAGERPLELAPVFRLDTPARIPLARLPPGHWFLAAAAITGVASGAVPETGPIGPVAELRLEADAAYVGEALLAAGAAGLAAAAVVAGAALLAARKGGGKELAGGRGPIENPDRPTHAAAS